MAADKPPQQKQQRKTKIHKKPRAPLTHRKIAPQRVKDRVVYNGSVSKTGADGSTLSARKSNVHVFAGNGQTRLREAPAGAILSSPHVKKSVLTRTFMSSFTHKFHRTRGSLARDLTAHRYQRMTFPMQVFTMICPGKEMPSDVSIFKVPMTMNRIQIKNYLEELYGVTVLKVNTAICIGKKTQDIYGRLIKKRDWKKAYVRTADDFAFPWPRPVTYSPTKKEMAKREKKKKEEKEEREKEKAAV